MQCPRCSLKLPRNTLVCARCGEETPRPRTGLSIDTRPPHDGPAGAPTLDHDVLLDRRGRGVRAVAPPPVRVRPAPPLWARPVDERLTSRRHLHAVPASNALAQAPAPAPAPSVVHQAKTDPLWHHPPADAPAPHERGEEAPANALAPATLAARLGAALLDVGVLGAFVAFAAFAAALAFGPARLAPYFNHGVDYVVDGLFLGQKLWLACAGLFVMMAAAYLTLSHALLGATFGKRLLGLAVVRADGERPSLGEAFARTVAEAFSLAPAGLGFVFAAFDREHLAWHDRLVGTRVVRR